MSSSTPACFDRVFAVDDASVSSSPAEKSGDAAANNLTGTSQDPNLSSAERLKRGVGENPIYVKRKMKIDQKRKVRAQKKNEKDGPSNSADL